MKIIQHGLLSLCLGILCLPAWADALSIRQAIDVALSQNPGIERQRQNTRSESMERGIAQAKRLPELELQAGVTHYSEPSLVWPIHQPGAFPPFDRDVGSLSLNLRLPLYSGGSLLAAVDLAADREAMARFAQQASQQEMIFNVVASFGKTLQLQHLHEAMQHRILRLEAQVKDARRRLRAGRAAELDVARIQTQLSEARYEQASLEQGIDNSLNLLTLLMGREQAPQRLESLPDIRLEPGLEIAAWEQQAIYAHPLLRQAQAGIDAAEQRVKVAQGERLPQLALVGNSRYLANSEGDGQDEWQLGLQMSVPLFDGSARSDRVSQARIKQQMAQLEHRELRDRIRYEVREAHAAVNTARSQIELAEQGLREAKEVLRIETLRYNTGSSTITDLLGAEAALWNARAKRTQAHYDAVINKSRLLKAVGRLDANVFLDVESFNVKRKGVSQ